MKPQNKKNIQASLIVTAGILAFILVVIIVYKNKNNILPKTNPKTIESQKENTTQTTEEKKPETKDVKNITGKVISVDMKVIKIKTEKEELTLNIPQKEVSFMTQKKQKDGSFLLKEIGLFDIPKNKDIDVQYDNQTKEVMLVVVK